MDFLRRANFEREVVPLHGKSDKDLKEELSLHFFCNAVLGEEGNQGVKDNDEGTCTFYDEHLGVEDRNIVENMRQMHRLSLAELEFYREPMVPASDDQVARVMARISNQEKPGGNGL